MLVTRWIQLVDDSTAYDATVAALECGPVEVAGRIADHAGFRVPAVGAAREGVQDFEGAARVNLEHYAAAVATKGLRAVGGGAIEVARRVENHASLGGA